MAKVSVIIPTYNRAKMIGETIQSVLDQKFRDFELIVVDDGSTDNTKEVVDSFKDPRINYISRQNSGPSAARNTGIQASSGDYIAFLDSDDLWLSDYLELMVRQLDSHNDLGLVCSDGYLRDDRTGVTIGTIWRTSLPGFNPQRAAKQPLKELLLRPDCFIRPPFTVVRRVVFNKVGYFDESLRNGEDWEIGIRIAHYFAIETLDIPLGWVRKHDASLTVRSVEAYQENLRTFNKVLCNSSLSRADVALVKRGLARTHYEYGKSILENNGIDLGREKLLSAIKVNPLCVKPYLYLAESFLGSKTVLAIKRWKIRIRRHLVSLRFGMNSQGKRAKLLKMDVSGF